VFDKVSDTWSVTVPAKFAGKTQGLCGLADGDMSNDLWVGSYAVAPVSATSTASGDDLASFFNHWLVDDTGAAGGLADSSPSCLSDALPDAALIAGAGSALVRSTCERYFGSKFADLTGVVDPSEYIDTCVRTIADLPVLKPDAALSASWPGCSVFAAYVSAASRVGKCIEWRTADFCPYSGCSADFVYNGCGPSVMKTCDNYKTYNVIDHVFNTEGCFCVDGKVCASLVYINSSGGQPLKLPNIALCRASYQ